jgi:hypothetical protein
MHTYMYVIQSRVYSFFKKMKERARDIDVLSAIASMFSDLACIWSNINIHNILMAAKPTAKSTGSCNHLNAKLGKAGIDISGHLDHSAQLHAMVDHSWPWDARALLNPLSSARTASISCLQMERWIGHAVNLGCQI